MAQNRDAPAYQEYAASVMAKTQYRVLSLSERGLLYTLKLECWVNREMPSDPATLARVLGFDAADVARALPQVLHHLQRVVPILLELLEALLRRSLRVDKHQTVVLRQQAVLVELLLKSVFALRQLPQPRRLQPGGVSNEDEALGLQDRGPIRSKDIPDGQRGQAGAVR